MKKLEFLLLCITLIITGVCISGCTSTSPASTTAQPATSTMLVTTTFPPTNIAEAATSVSLVSTTVPTIIKTTSPTSPTGGVSVTINSAGKKTTLGGLSPIKGSVFLVLDVTLQNNDKNNDFAYTPASFQIIANNPGAIWHASSITKFSSGLNNQLTSGTIPMKSKTTGQIVFGVSDSSNLYQFSLRDSSGNELTKIENINVP